MSRTWRQLASKRQPKAEANKESSLRFWIVDKSWQMQLFDHFKNVCSDVLRVKPTMATPPEMDSCGQTDPLTIGRSEYPRTTMNVIGDGNCFFRCISYVLCGSEGFHTAVRHWVVSSLSSRDVGMSVARYIHRTRMDRRRVWATEHEISATAKLLKTDIFVFSKHGREWKWMEFRGNNRRQRRNIPKRAIYLHHHRQCHFRLVFSVRRTQQ